MTKSGDALQVRPLTIPTRAPQSKPSKHFTNGRLRIDFFQPSCRLRGNDAIMGRFDKPLIINWL